MAAAFLQAINAALPILYFSRFQDAASAGILTLVLGSIAAPVAFVTTSLGQVVNAEFAGLIRTDPGRIRTTFRRRLKQTTLAGFAVLALYSVLVPAALPYVFSGAWSDATIAVTIVSPLLAASVIAGPFGCLLDVAERQRLALARELTRTFLGAGALNAAYSLNLNWRSTLALYTGAATLGYVCYGVFSWHAIRFCSETVSTTAVYDS
jgi:O-antigen/teichoic acid export membrane protein